MEGIECSRQLFGHNFERQNTLFQFKSGTVEIGDFEKKNKKNVQALEHLATSDVVDALAAPNPTLQFPFPLAVSSVDL